MLLEVRECITVQHRCRKMLVLQPFIGKQRRRLCLGWIKYRKTVQIFGSELVAALPQFLQCFGLHGAKRLCQMRCISSKDRL